MELYDENELQRAIDAGERRLAEAKQRKRRQEKWRLFALALIAIAIPIGVAASIASGRAPQAPLLLATWPKPKVQQVFASGQTLLFRSGQPFDLTIEGAENWDITWVTGGIENKGASFSWSPTDAAGKVVASCRPLATDWTGLFSFLWPTREVTLQSVMAPRVGLYGRELRAGQGVWIYPHIFASGHVAWDERALGRLAQAMPLPLEAESALDEAKKTPSKFAWRLVSDFEGYSDKPSTAGTFASLHAPDLENTLPEIATKIVQIAPDASVKFIIRLDKTPPEGIVRLDFDGKRERKAWIRRKGEAAGAPLTGWEDGQLGGETPINLAPTLPRDEQ